MNGLKYLILQAIHTMDIIWRTQFHFLEYFTFCIVLFATFLLGEKSSTFQVSEDGQTESKAYLFVYKPTRCTKFL